MKVILKTDVKKVGRKGSVVEVADGYGRNVLIARGLAVPATGGNLRTAEADIAHAAARAAMDAGMARVTLAKLDGQTVTITAKANPQGGLFVAVRALQIAEAIEQQLQAAVPADAIALDDPIKKTGSYPVSLSLSGQSARLTLLVSSPP